jgi:hypothetical protein
MSDMNEHDRAERKRKFQENIKKMKFSPAHPDAGKPIDMIPYMKKNPESVKGFLKDSMKEHENPYWDKK